MNVLNFEINSHSIPPQKTHSLKVELGESKFFKLEGPYFNSSREIIRGATARVAAGIEVCFDVIFASDNDTDLRTSMRVMSDLDEYTISVESLGTSGTIFFR